MSIARGDEATAGSAAGPPRTLADDLRRRDDVDLEALLRHRPDLLNPVPRDFTDLVNRAAARFSVTRAMDGLDRFTLQVLDAVAHLADGCDAGAVTRLVPTDPAVVVAALARLRERALLWGTDEALHLVRAAREALGTGPGGTGPPLASAAGGYPPARLQHLLTDLGLPTTADPTSAIVALRDLLGSPAGLARVLAEAPDEALDLLHKVDRAAGGVVDRADRTVRPDEALTPLEWLLSRGVLVALDAQTVVLPAEVAVALRGGALYPDPSTAPPEADPVTVGSTQSQRSAAGQVLSTLQQVESLLEAWAAEPPAALRSGGGLGVRDLKRAQTLLNLPPAGTALIVELAFVAGLASTDGHTGETWLPTVAYDKWLALDSAARWTELVAAWLATSRVAALVGTRSEATGKDRPLSALGADLDRAWAAPLRRSTLAELAALPEGTTTDAAHVLARLVWAGPRRFGASQEAFAHAVLAEAAQLGVTGLGCLPSWSRALLAGDTDAASDRLRAALPAPLDHVLIQADLTAVAPGPLTRELSVELAAAAEVESTGAATVYRFTADSVRRALDLGRTAAELHELLAQASRTGVPQPLTYLIDDVARRHGRIRVGTAKGYLRCDDEGVVAELLAAKGTATLKLRRIAPTVVTAGVGPEELLRALRELGYAPTSENASGTVTVARPTPRRSKPARPPVPVWAVRETPPSLVGAAVRALRAGDRASSAARRAAGAPVEVSDEDSAFRGVLVARTSTATTMERLRAAAEAGSSVWLGYVTDDGTSGESIVDPLTLDSGVLRAFDHRYDKIREFKLSRIRAVADA
ncbi:MAG: helicase-associated domain-containing protein [Sporichthyaceae bacterium]